MIKKILFLVMILFQIQTYCQNEYYWGIAAGSETYIALPKLSIQSGMMGNYTGIEVSPWLLFNKWFSVNVLYGIGGEIFSVENTISYWKIFKDESIDQKPGFNLSYNLKFCLKISDMQFKIGPSYALLASKEPLYREIFLKYPFGLNVEVLFKIPN